MAMKSLGASRFNSWQVEVGLIVCLSIIVAVKLTPEHSRLTHPLSSLPILVLSADLGQPNIETARNVETVTRLRALPCCSPQSQSSCHA